MEKEFEKKFDKCPVCAFREEIAQILGKPELSLGDGKNAFCGEMGEEMKERGLARPEWNFHLDLRKGVVVDQKKETSIPIGTEVPGFGIATDICLDCGCVFATDLIRTNEKKPAPILAPPNRAQRRRGDQGPGLVGPFSTS